MLTLAFAPHRAWYLVWIGFVPMLVAQHRVLPGRLSALAPGIAVGGFVAGCFGGVFPERAAWYMKQLPLLVGVIVTLSSLGGPAGRARAGYGYWPLQGAIGLGRRRARALAHPRARDVGLPRLRALQADLAPAAGRDLRHVRARPSRRARELRARPAALRVARSTARSRRDRPGDGGAFVPMRLAVRWCAGVAVACVLWGALSVAMLPRGAGAPTVRVAALQPGYRWRGECPLARGARSRDPRGAHRSDTARRRARGALHRLARVGAARRSSNRLSRAARRAREGGRRLSLRRLLARHARGSSQRGRHHRPRRRVPRRLRQGPPGRLPRRDQHHARDVPHVRDAVRRRRRRHLRRHRLHRHAAQARAQRREDPLRTVGGLARDLDQALRPRGLPRARDGFRGREVRVWTRLRHRRRLWSDAARASSRPRGARPCSSPTSPLDRACRSPRAGGTGWVGCAWLRSSCAGSRACAADGHRESSPRGRSPATRGRAAWRPTSAGRRTGTASP